MDPGTRILSQERTPSSPRTCYRRGTVRSSLPVRSISVMLPRQGGGGGEETVRHLSPCGGRGGEVLNSRATVGRGRAWPVIGRRSGMRELSSPLVSLRVGECLFLIAPLAPGWPPARGCGGLGCASQLVALRPRWCGVGYLAPSIAANTVLLSWGGVGVIPSPPEMAYGQAAGEVSGVVPKRKSQGPFAGEALV